MNHFIEIRSLNLKPGRARSCIVSVSKRHCPCSNPGTSMWWSTVRHCMMRMRIMWSAARLKHYSIIIF